MYEPSTEEREIEERLRRLPAPGPSEAVRNRVLARCRQARSARQAQDRRLRWAWRGAVVGAAAALLLFDVTVQRVSDERVAHLLGGPEQVQMIASHPVPLITAMRARRAVLVAVLDHPDAP